MRRTASRIAAIVAALALPLAAGACLGGDDGPVRVAVIGEGQTLESTGLRLSPAGQLVRAATTQGLVAFDADGEIVPAMADSWIVTDDGRSYIFRLRNATWPDGTRIDGQGARTALMRAMEGLEGTSLGLDLAPVSQVRAMAGRVVEIRLSMPVPNLLQVLAQPELALRRDGAGLGKMEVIEGRGADAAGEAMLSMRPPGARGMPQDEDWEEDFRQVSLVTGSAEDLIARFFDGQLDVVTEGTLAHLPLADPGPLSRGALRLDPAVGLLGLQFVRARGVLETPEGRDALSLALDRDALAQPLGVAGWLATTRIVPPDFYGDLGVPERWEQFSLEDRRAEAARRLGLLASQQGEGSNRVALYLAPGPGHDALFAELAAQWATVGLDIVRATEQREADLVLVDRVARFADPRWFLNQFHCSLDRGLCSETADEGVAAAVRGEGELDRVQLMEQAESQMLRDAVYIPLGAPIRWSLVRGGQDGFVANPWAFHPLPPLATLPR